MKTFSEHLEEFNEYGVIREVYHPVVLLSGLPRVKPGEVVVFEDNSWGMVMSLGADAVEVLLFSQKPLPVGFQAARTGNPLSIPLGQYLVGQVLDALGNPQLEISGQFAPEEEREIDVPAPSIAMRQQIRQPQLTGISMVDILLPLGKGQRELVVGDRKTGKTSFLLTAMKSHILAGGVVVYAAVGKKSIELDQLKQFFVREGMLGKMVVLATTSHDSPSMVYIAPFSAMTLAEYFRDHGQDVLVVLDDLSTHAKFYREISLLARRFPGRDSYPGDIFFTHARLLERAGNFKHPTVHEVAITCLPVGETIENDLTDYIVSNLIGITDGHLLFDTTEFIKGRRPAINPSYSVTRVGKQTQTLLHQQINQQLMLFLGQYARSQNYAHFGAELTDSVKKIIQRGDQLYSVFNQSASVVVPLEVQMVLLGMVWNEVFIQTEIADIPACRDRLVAAYGKEEKVQHLIDEVVSVKSWEELLGRVQKRKNQLLLYCQAGS